MMNDERGTMNEETTFQFFIHHSSSRVHRLLRCCPGDGDGFADQLSKAAETGGHACAEIDADGAAAARSERAEIAERLRLLQRVEAVRLAGNRHVARVGCGDLYE